ncbi:HNH endonuclease [Litorimonas haliclonae]|uniref:HNH endonuclease n=1 Tax=Litorimonas haliclonae TaxID=2081977 RepID=UPI0039F006B1
MKGRQINYSEEELAFLRSHAKTPRRRLAELFNDAFGRNVSLENIKAKCTRMGLKTGRTGCYSKGHVSHNKGRKGWCAPGSEKGWFKKGTQPPNQRPIGSERVCPKDGYILIKIDETNPHTGHRGHFVLKHRHLWEQQNGPVPEGYFLKCLDGNKLNTCPTNWECMPNGMKTRLVAGNAGREYDNAPVELKPTILATAKVEQRLYELIKERK